MTDGMHAAISHHQEKSEHHHNCCIVKLILSLLGYTMVIHIVAFLLAMVLMDVQGCINTSPVLRQCGKVWEVTRVQFLLTPQNRHDILMCWDIYPMCESLSIVSNSTEETFYNMEHVYNESGSYKLSSEITVLQNVSANDSVDEWAMCIGYKTLLNYDWTLNVNADSCEEQFKWTCCSSSSEPKYSLGTAFSQGWLVLLQSLI